MEELTSGAFAAASRLSPKALRIYAESGLLVPARTDPCTGYRFYAAAQLERARLIAALRRIGMPLARIASVCELARDDAAVAVGGYWDEVEADTAVRRALTALLVDQLSGKETPMLEVAVRTVPDRLLLAVKRHLNIEELSAFATEHALMLGDGTVPGLPGIEGAPFLVFYGEVGRESDGPVEYCRAVPADRAEEIAARFGHMELRRDPAHREAYVRLTRSQSGPVDGGRAAVTLQRWAQEGGHVPSGPPRTVFFADPRTAGPGDPVSDVVCPLPADPS